MTRQDTRQSSRASSTNKQSSNQTKQATNKQSSNQSSQQDRSVGKPLSRQAQKHERRQEEQHRRQQQRQRAARLRGALIGSIVAAFVAFAVINPRLHPSQNQNQGAQSQSTESIFNAAYPPVDSIFCDQLEQSASHYHALVYIYINGQQVQVPQGVGIASDSSCFYWMHTHDTTGVIHIEAPNGRDFTLGNFLDIWSTHFSGYHNELSSADGWTVYIGSQKYNGDFHNIVLKSHMIVTLAYNSPGVKPNPIYSWGTL